MCTIVRTALRILLFTWIFILYYMLSYMELTLKVDKRRQEMALISIRFILASILIPILLSAFLCCFSRGNATEKYFARGFTVGVIIAIIWNIVTLVDYWMLFDDLTDSEVEDQ